MVPVVWKSLPERLNVGLAEQLEASQVAEARIEYADLAPLGERLIWVLTLNEDFAPFKKYDEHPFVTCLTEHERVAVVDTRSRLGPVFSPLRLRQRKSVRRARRSVMTWLMSFDNRLRLQSLPTSRHTMSSRKRPVSRRCSKLHPLRNARRRKMGSRRQADRAQLFLLQIAE